MLKNILFTILLLSNFSVFSQQIVSYIPMELKSNRDFFQIINEEKSETTFFVSDRKKVLIYLLDEKMAVKDSISTERPKKKYSDIIGFSGEKSSPKLFWSNTNRDELFCQFFDIKNRKVNNSEHKLELDGEKFLQQFSENGKFYILTFIKENETLKLYVFDENGKLETKNLDFSESKIISKKGESKGISEVLRKNSTMAESESGFRNPFNSFKKSFEIKKITYQTPTSLTDSSEKIKCYIANNKIIISFDENDTLTQLLSIDLNNYKSEIKSIEKPYINDSENETLKTNSFIFDNKLFQVVTTKYQMKFVIKDLEGNLIKEYVANESEIISFKNSEMFRLSSTGGKRILDKTEQFLNKISSFDFGVTCYKTDGDYTITIGSISDVRNQGGGFGIGIGIGGGGFGGMNGSFGTMHFGGYNSFGYNYFNSVSDNFNSYANRKVIYIDCKFDSSGNHLKGDIKPHVFEKIKEHLDNEDSYNSKSLFKVGNTYYLSFYNVDMHQIRIIKFTE